MDSSSETTAPYKIIALHFVDGFRMKSNSPIKIILNKKHKNRNLTKKMAPRITSVTRGTTVSLHVQLLQTTLNLFFRCHPRFIFAAFSQDLIFSQQHNGKSFHLRHQSYVRVLIQYTIPIFSSTDQLCRASQWPRIRRETMKRRRQSSRCLWAAVA